MNCFEIKSEFIIGKHGYKKANLLNLLQNYLN